MDADLGSDYDIDINLDEFDGILTFYDSDFDLVDDINIDELNDVVDVIPLYVNVWEDERNGDGRDGMIKESEFDENMDKEDEIWAEGEGSESDGTTSVHSSEEEARSRWHVFNAKRDMKDPKFSMECYLQTRRASTNKKEKAIQIKKFKDNHKCALEIPQRYITYKWLSETYKEHLRADPKFSNKSLAHQLEVDFKEKTCGSKLWRARRHALEKVIKSEVEQLWTFMSDKEKGLIVALDELMPHAEKRFCVRHLWKNLCRATTIKGGPELKDLLWNAAKATYPAEYYRRMALMKKKISRHGSG
ncbi:hypothetical protein SASPL_105235 [Salvia splendens]|uniref:Uncharacterized protein n=1 Tax=Salvia splendens TaxID=180675 RepID=A0A8X8YIN2_SALSN|nr:hypothetical protein SASPL_105235 [Salvia splendens]